MFSAEVLSQLRSLNWLTQEIRRVPRGSREAALIRTQMEAVRARLPEAILDYHDRVAVDGRPSAVQISGERCGNCAENLPEELRQNLATPGRFAVCPSCGVFLWGADPPDQPPESRRPTIRATHA